jgi:CBS domain-containing protein
MKIKDLMTREVIAVQPGASLKEAARLLVAKEISGMPVVDRDGRVLGVLSEADLLVKERGGRSGDGPLSWLLDPLDVVDRIKLDARFVGEAMTAPPITIASTRPVAAAGALMIERGVNRLPVVDDGNLVGIVTRGDLIRAFARTDAEIAREIRDDVVAAGMWLDRKAVQIRVEEGEVELTGELDRRSEVEVITALAAKVPGVISVRPALTWADDDGRRGH